MIHCQIANAIEQITGIPKDCLYRPLSLGGDTQRTVFIPSDIWKFKDGQHALKISLTDDEKKLKDAIIAGEKKVKLLICSFYVAILTLK